MKQVIMDYIGTSTILVLKIFRKQLIIAINILAVGMTIIETSLASGFA